MLEMLVFMILGGFCYFQDTISQHFRPKSKKELGQFYFFTSPVAVKTLKYSKLASEKLAAICRFLPWVKISGETCGIIVAAHMVKLLHNNAACFLHEGKQLKVF